MPAYVEKGPPWSADDDALLESKWAHEGIESIAALLKRSVCAVYQRAKRNNLGPAAAHRKTLGAFANETGYARSRIMGAARKLRLRFTRLPRVTSKPTKKVNARRLIVNEEQQEKILEYLKKIPDGERLYVKPRVSRDGEWNQGKKPPQCLGHGGTDMPHRARGYCKSCYDKIASKNRVRPPRKDAVPVGIWGKGKRPKFCTRCDTRLRPHYAAGQCKRCYYSKESAVARAEKTASKKKELTE